VTLQDYGAANLGVRGKAAADVTVDEHLRVLTTASKLVDSAVSKTLNVPHTMPWDDFKSIYFRAWEEGAKGCTTFTSGGKRDGILKAVEEGGACTIGEDGIRSCE
jgi:ribonucleoside-diphosphate reductase alpha chain